MKNYILSAVLLATAHLCSAQTDGGNFGSKDPSLFNLKGIIYELPEGTESMPTDLDKQKPLGTIYTQKLDIPVRDFQEGFPGVTDRFEWFGIVYTATFEISESGLYSWKTISDDGSRLWIDGEEVVNNDGIHGMNDATGDILLADGKHSIKIWYYQGPATQIGMQLFVSNSEEFDSEGEALPDWKIFDLANFNASYSDAAKKVNAIATPEGIKVELPDNILFDVAKYDLKSSADATLELVAELINGYPNCTVKIDGHTDAVGKAETNKLLSENRAKSVAAALQKKNITTGIKFQTEGFGATKPIAANDTEANRAKNRRVDILIIP